MGDEGAIDYGAVIHQLQLENEMLRSHVRTLAEMRAAINKVPNFVETLYHKVSTNKYAVLLGLMIIYWACSIALMIYDRIPPGGGKGGSV